MTEVPPTDGTVFLDLDGTLLESRPRVYTLFNRLAPQPGWSFDDYWQRKYAGLKHPELLASLGWEPAAIADFQRDWHAAIESEPMLALDHPIPGATGALLELRRHQRLVLITARQREEGVRSQLHRLGWSELFDRVLVTGPSRTKLEVLRREGFGGEMRGWMVGDTGNDVETGKALGLFTVAVLSGFMTLPQLRRYEPDLIVPDVTALPLLSSAAASR